MDIETILPWGPPREIPHLRKQVRNAPVTDAFRALWNLEQAALRAAGVGWSEWPKGSGKWQISWWQPIPEKVVAARQASAALSRSAGSEFDPPRPEGLNFYPFQRAGIEFLTKRPASLLADEMGLGKTLQAIGLVNCDPTIERVLVVTKASLKENWKREMKKWLTRPMSIGIATGPKWPHWSQSVIINYDLLSKHAKMLRPAKPWDLVILDESAAIKNRDAKRTQAVIGRRAQPKKNLSEIAPIPARFRICISGTPIENRPEELWTTLHYLDPVRWTSFWSYAKRYCGMVNNGWGVDTGGASNLGELQQILRETLMIRRLKADVLTELPPKTRVIVELEGEGLESCAEDEERSYAAHREALEAAQTTIELARASDDDQAFKAAVKSLASQTVAFTELARVRHQTAVRKVPAMIEAIREDLEETSKLIVFGHHRDVLTPIWKAFPGACIITGETPPEDRQGICDRFQTDPACRVFVGSIRACGEGLTLTAAKLVVFAEQDWVPGKVSQAEDRAHRIGQKDNVLVKHYVLPGTIDAKMIQTIVAKQEIIDQALDGGGIEAVEPAILPEHRPLARRKELAEEAELITAEERDRIHAGLRALAGVCDGAQKLDGQGFNGVDARIGHALADLPVLTNRQAALGRKLLVKYRRQLGVAQ